MTQICEYVKYKNGMDTVSVEHELYSKIIEKVYGVIPTTTENTPTNYKYVIEQFDLKKSDNNTFTIYLCAERTVVNDVDVFSNAYLCIPELNSERNELNGLSIYKIDTNQLKLQLGITSLDGDNKYTLYGCIDTTSGIALLGCKSVGNTERLFAFPNKSCFLEGRHEDLYEEFEGKLYEFDVPTIDFLI